MSDPAVTCTTCGRQMKLAFGWSSIRPERAKRVLRKSCKYLDYRCRFTYTAGVEIRGAVTGQEGKT